MELAWNKGLYLNKWITQLHYASCGQQISWHMAARATTAFDSAPKKQFILELQD